MAAPTPLKHSILSHLKKEALNNSANIVAIITILICLYLTINLSIQAYSLGAQWQEEIDFEWIPLLGVRFHLVANGLSVVMMILTLVITLLALIYSWKEKTTNSGLYYLCLLFMVSAVMMFFVVKDLFLLCFVWESVTLPLYFLIALWGRRDATAQVKFNGASKFLIFTQITCLLMVISVISLALANWKLTNEWTFDYFELNKTAISSQFEFILMLGFLLTFIVRIPLVPFHGWFIDAHIDATTTGSLLISGLLVNTAIYGLTHFVFMLFPNASLLIMPVMCILSLFTLIYASLLCFSQKDIKRLVAYSHVALMGFVTAGLYSISLLAYQGAILQLAGISLTVVGLFIISGLLAERYLTRNIEQFSGLKSQVKYLTTLTLFFMLSILGLPGTANFTGGIMMLLGSYNQISILAIAMIVGVLLLTISVAIRIQPIFYNTEKPVQKMKALSLGELMLLAIILFLLFFIGLYPQWIIDLSSPSLTKLQQVMNVAQSGITGSN